YQDNSTLKSIIEKLKEFRNFEVNNSLIYLKVSGKKLLCIPRIMVNDRSLHEITISEAHSIFAHLGASKTLDYLSGGKTW
ncbi:hypothetical protein BYT27DRAFT_7021404, partial [Phlegmacium glaucopus]